MCDLNPIELAWVKIKQIVRGHNLTADLSLAKLLKVTNEAMQEVTADDWAGFCPHVESQEKLYWEKDGIVTDVIDEIIINLHDDTDGEYDIDSACSGLLSGDSD
jgi:hypothetical protein